MTVYMLDTNILVYAIRHPGDAVNDGIAEHVANDICISSITYGELEYGICKSAHPEQNRQALRQMLSGIPILDFDWLAAEHFGDIFAELERQGQRIGERDMLIAAHARSLNYTLVTNNTREFGRVPGLAIEDWLNR